MDQSPKHIDWSKYKHLLGVLSDGDVAQLAGCSARAVLYQRRKLNITASRHGIDWQYADRVLGMVPDDVLAAWIGVSQTAVWKRRTDRGIPPVRK